MPGLQHDRRRSGALLRARLQLTPAQAEIAERLLVELQERLRFLNDVGLEYLTLDRLASTLSGGEAQRIQLATSLGSRLVGTLYVLDEPSIGLHSRDTHRLIKILHGLRDLGNTILVVEHDPDIMRAADRILDLGPGAGESGGKVIGAGTYAEILQMPQSLTGRYLANELAYSDSAAAARAGVAQNSSDRRSRAQPEAHRSGNPARHAGRDHGRLGIGQIFAAARCAVSRAGGGEAAVEWQRAACAVLWDEIEGDEYLDEVVLVDQSPIGRTPRSNPVTYIKAFDIIRELLPRCRKRRSVASRRDIFLLTFRAAAAKLARAMAQSRWKCSFSPMSN